MKFNLFKKKSAVPKVDLTKRFDLLGRVGQGSMSQVWRARDSMSGRVVAVKVLDKQKTEKFEHRYLGLEKPSEGEIAIGLRHPNVVHTFEHGITTDDENYLVMEFLDGVALTFLVDMQNSTMKQNRLRLMIEIGEALAYIHEQGFIHHDISPENVILDDEKSAKIIDMGVTVPNTEEFRKPGNRTGMANYMAPELVRRQHIDERIDVFSFSVTCYEMFTKQLPWRRSQRGESLETASRRINNEGKHIQELMPEIDDEVASIIMKGVTIEPDRRWNSIRNMVDALSKARGRLEAGNVPDDYNSGTKRAAKAAPEAPSSGDPDLDRLRAARAAMKKRPD